MRAMFFTLRGLLAIAIIAMASVGIAEVTRGMPQTKMTPELLKQASTPLPSTTGLSYHLRTEVAVPRPTFAASREQFEPVREFPSHGCAQNSGALCYDYRAGHTVYKPAQRLLPAIPGMTPEALSIRHNKIVARYSFK
jgi:hypothetical protein